MPECERIVGAGQVALGGAGTRLSSVVGSGVTVTLWQAQRRRGGLCHFLLPGASRAAVPDARYAEDALFLLGQLLQQEGVAMRECEVRLFGGSGTGIGEQNLAYAREMLRRWGLEISSHDVGGGGLRTLVFDLEGGDVWLWDSAAGAGEAG